MNYPSYTDAEIRKIVLLGLQGTPVEEVCKLYSITNVMYYQWRDMIFTEVYCPRVNLNITKQY